ncbi:MAG: nucleoside triphosphate pyrophosphohydrolase [Pseudomonadota bacterium]
MASIQSLLEIMRALRDPHTGCPWDQQQTFATIAPYTLEEAYEVVEAIEANDLAALKDELGDLLLQVVFHAQMASEQDVFAFDDVVTAICDKMTRRHPHVFATDNAAPEADQPATTAAAVKASWQAQKQKEKGPEASLMDGLPSALPALKAAQKLGSRAAGIGFDWPSTAGALDKCREEWSELEEAIASRDLAATEEELGDLLFALVNVCRHRRVDAEMALRAANAKFARRFRQVEAAINASRTTMTLDEMEAVWQSAKSDLG